MKLQNLAFDLNERIFVLYLMDIVETRTVYIFIRIYLQQLGSSIYAQLFTQNVSPSRADILAICNIFI